MNRTGWKLAWLWLFVVPAVVTSSGCLVDMMALPYFLLGQEPNIDPPCTLLKGRKDKKKVLVLAFADDHIRYAFDSVDEDLTGLVIGELLTKEQRFEVVPERKVRSWKDKNPNWNDMNLQQVGEQFDVDVILFFEVTELSLNETKNQFLLHGEATARVRIYDVNKEGIIYSDTYKREYPPNRSVPLSDSLTEAQFRRKFLCTIGRELSWYVVPHRHMDRVSDI